MADAHKNFAYTTVATAPSPADSGTSLTVETGDGALFPTPPFNVTIWPANSIPTAINAEIARVTNKVGDALTITRQQEGSTVRAIAVGDQIGATITAKTLSDIESVASFAGTGYVNLGFTGTAPVNTTTAYGRIPYSGTIRSWTLLASGTALGTAPSCTVDIIRIASGSSLPTVSMIGAGTKPALSSAYVSGPTPPSSWTSTAFTSGDLIAAVLTQTAKMASATLQLEVLKN